MWAKQFVTDLEQRASKTDDYSYQTYMCIPYTYIKKEIILIEGSTAVPVFGRHLLTAAFYQTYFIIKYRVRHIRNNENNYLF